MGKAKVFKILFILCIFNGIQVFGQHVYAQKDNRLPKERICHLQRCHRYFKY